MTEARVLADRLVERVFKKEKSPAPQPVKPSARPAIQLRLQAAREQRETRQRLIRHFKEF